MRRTKIFLCCNNDIALPGITALLEKHDWIEIFKISRDLNFADIPVGTETLLIYSTDKTSVTLEKLSNLQKMRITRPYNVVLFVHGLLGGEETLNFSMQNVRVFLSAQDESAEIEQAFRALRFNQYHFSTKACFGVSTIEHLLKLASQQSKKKKIGTGISSLTKRELLVWKMLVEGESIKGIANDLNLSLKTIETHKFNLMSKLDIHNKAHLVRYAVERGIISIEKTGT